MNIITKKCLSICALFSGILFVNQNASAYSEAQISAEGVFFPKENLDSDQFSPFAGWSIRADIMNNVGFSFGIGHTYSEGYRFVDAREIYWPNEHMFGFYGGLSEHLQYFNNMGFGAGIALGYSLPLTYYVNLNIEGEGGYGSSKFYRSIYDPFYFVVSAGISINVM